jgi:hypothetical protein
MRFQQLGDSKFLSFVANNLMQSHRALCRRSLMDDLSSWLVLMTVLVLSLTSCATVPSTNGSSLHNPAQRVFLVRHAERFTDSREDPPLTAEAKKEQGVS